MGVDAVGVAGLDVALRQREMSAGGDVDGVDGDAVGGGDGRAGSTCFYRLRHVDQIIRRHVTSKGRAVRLRRPENGFELFWLGPECDF